MVFVLGLIFLDKRKRNNRLLLAVLSLSVFIEFFSIYLLLNKLNLNKLYSIGFILHNSLWLIILFNVFKKKESFYIIIVFYILFGILNILFIEKDNLNYSTFIIGALLYIFIFLLESFKKLNDENLLFFISIKNLLIIVPLLFFFGFSILFGFSNSHLFYEKIIGEINLYTFISLLVNILYYVFIFIYIIKERKLKNA